MGLMWPSDHHLKGLGSSETPHLNEPQPKKAALEQETRKLPPLKSQRISTQLSFESSQETGINFLSLQQEAE